MTQGYFDTGLFRMGLFWFGVILAWSYYGLGLFWWGYFSGVISVRLFRWGHFGLRLFHSYCSPFSTVDMVKGILCLVVFCTMISLFQSEGRGGSTITTIIGPLAHETSTFNPIGTFQ